MKILPFMDTVNDRYRSYSRHVLGYRHFAEGRDGLKPVQRRLLWVMKLLGAVDKPHLTLLSAITGATTGGYHPHGEVNVAEAAVNMCQENMYSPLVMGIGNWGSLDQPAGAPRYIKAYMSSYALSMFDSDELTCVPMDRTYSGKDLEPRFLPTKLPHLLIGGCQSLAPGYKGNIPPCKPEWVLDSIERTMRRQPLLLPKSFAYRWGGDLIKLESEWLESGNGRALFKPKVAIEVGMIILTTIAPGLSISKIEERLEADPAFAGIAKESPKNEDLLRLVLRVKRGHNVAEFAKRVRNICKTISHYYFLQITQITDDMGDVDFKPVIEGPESFLIRWVRWRKNIVVGAAEHRALMLRKEADKINLLLLVILKRHEIDKIRDSSKSRDETKKRLQKLLKCNEEDATYVMTFPWPKLSTLESPPLLQKRREVLIEAKRNDLIAEKPSGRLLDDAEDAVKGVTLARQQAATMRYIPTKGDRRARR